MVRNSPRQSPTYSNGSCRSPPSSPTYSTSASGHIFSILRACALCMASLYVGFYLGYKEGVAQTSRILTQELKKAKPEDSLNLPQPQQPPPVEPSQPQQPLLTKGTKSFLTGMSLVDRKEFAYKFDTGVPLFGSHGQNSQVLLLHAKGAMPGNSSETQINRQLSVDDATKNCNYLSLILTEPDRNDQCIAIMGQYNSYHISKFMRIVPNKKPAQIENSRELQLVKRGTDTRSFMTETPSVQLTRKYWQMTLQPYLTNLQKYLDKLKPIAQQVATKNTIIVMTANYGQSELLHNFVCNAQQRNLDTSMILVFATDKETYDLSQGLGLASFYDQQLYAQIPKKHAARFGDATYKAAIFSKLYCVHLVGLLGYDYLFMDVDLIWYKHPLDFFHQPKLPFRNQNYEIYMQNDGNYANFYMPYSGNTGFYYVKNTARTQYFMNHFLVSGDLILSTSTHQAPFLSVLSEHASLHGLKVKVLPGDDFPGGYHYQQKKLYMKYLMKAQPAPASVKIDPWIFHMSWTLNKDSKIQFLQQMGEWFVKPVCLAPKGGFNATDVVGSAEIKQHCCSANPVLKCHWRDTPSVIPCHDSPALANDRGSWYPKQ